MWINLSNAEYNWVTFDNLEDEIYHEICAYQDDINVQVDDRTVEYLLKYVHIAKGVGFGKRK
ncbi:MAG: hypothetical protein ACPKQO_11545 [Nitrososphaeraceae archaeon]